MSCPKPQSPYWEGQAQARSLSKPFMVTTEWCLGSSTFPYRDVKSPHNLCWAVVFVWEYSPLSWTCCVLPCSVWGCASWHLANPTAVSVPGGVRMEFFACSAEGCVQTISLHGLWAEPCWPWEWCSLSLEALSVYHVSKALFHPQPVWVVSFLATSPPANYAVSGLTPWGCRPLCQALLSSL